MRQNEVNHVIKLFVVAHKQCELTMGLKKFCSSIENFDSFVAEAEHKIVRVDSNSGTCFYSLEDFNKYLASL